MESELRKAFRAGQAAPRRQGDAPKHDNGAAEALLREFHHRVNNNMQLISSLVLLQANTIQRPDALEAFEEFGGRIRTMALAYQKLNRDGAWGQVDFKEFLESLVDAVLLGQPKGAKVRRHFQMESFPLGIKTAIPVGLIANELLSARLKYAFAVRPEGLVCVSLSRLGDECRMALGDDGCAAEETLLEAQSLGIRLVKILTGQIRGQMEYRNKRGAEFVLVFKDAVASAT